jgi:general secretion pathway protein G
MKIDAASLTPADKPQMTEEQKAQFDGIMKAMLGSDGLVMSMAVRNGALVVVIGDASRMKDAFARAASKSPSPIGAAMLAELGNLNPGGVYRIDFGRFVGGMAGLMSQIESMGLPNAGSDLAMLRSLPAIQIVAGVDGRVWKLGITTNVAKFVAAIRGLTASKPATRENRAKATADITQIRSALSEYAMNNAGKYPDSLESLVTPDMNGYRYLNQKTIPVDPWGHEYLYDPPTPGKPTPRVYSLGADGKPGGTGEAADIDSESTQHAPR